MITGPDIIKDGLVFGYDASDISYRFYKGEPTTNLIPSPSINSLPTFGNWWGTYNTNQYCGNNGCAVYWDLPTITSISNNIVTTVTNHGLRTCDAINPQTSGGGVTGGETYFVKVISPTQFSLHSYNSSQDGSQGYINPVTGTYKVHDSIALDQRITISASGFPTKWFGSAHLPNSGLVKEIRVNGYKSPYTGEISDCMRLHMHRTQGVDGMAYGPDSTVTIGVPVTTSFMHCSVSPSAVGKSVSFSHYNYGGVDGANSFGSSFTLGPVGVWQKFSMTFTPTHSALISYWFPQGDYIYDLDIANIQTEQKSHSTQFTTGTRTSSQCLIDLKKTAAIDLSNVSFDSTAHPIFDGTDDYISIPTYPAIEIVDNLSVELVYMRLTTDPVIDVIAQKYANGWEFLHSTSGNIGFCGRNGDGTYYPNYTSSVVPNNKYHHLVGIKSGLFWKIYVNGQLENSITANSIGTMVTSNPLVIGREGDSYYPNMKLPVFKIYNKALTESEIRINFNAYKNRFNI